MSFIESECRYDFVKVTVILIMNLIAR